MTSSERRRSTTFSSISALLLIIHVLVSYRDVTAAMNENRRDKSAESTLGHQRYTDLPYAADGNDAIPNTSSPRQLWSGDDVDPRDITQDTLMVKDGVRDMADKRKWAKNTVRVWGKRSDVGQEWLDVEDLDDTDEHVDGGKRSWSKNKVRVWGKRNTDDEVDKLLGMSTRTGGSGTMTASKRKWSNNKVRVWGKRGHDEVERTSQLDLSSYLASVTDARERPTAVKSRLPAAATSATTQYRSKTSATGQRRGARSAWASDNDDVTENEPDVIDDVLRKRAAIVKRAIDESSDRSVDRLAWIPGEKAFFAYNPSTAPFEDRWSPTAAKRVMGSTTYVGGSSSSSLTRGSRYPFFAVEGPKRSWRTNVIRVWG